MLKYNQKQLAFIILRRDFLMKRNVYRILGCFLFAFTLCLMTPSFVKASVKNIPLLGYLFAKLHIQVDRSDKDSRAKSILRSKRALDSGRSLFIMPEGGIVSTSIPKMHQPFKDGAFSLAIESGVPIVPISFLNLYESMPDKMLQWGIPKVIIHQPITTKGMTKHDIEALKEKVYNTIQTELDAYK